MSRIHSSDRALINKNLAIANRSRVRAFIGLNITLCFFYKNENGCWNIWKHWCAIKFAPLSFPNYIVLGSWMSDLRSSWVVPIHRFRTWSCTISGDARQPVGSGGGASQCNPVLKLCSLPQLSRDVKPLQFLSRVSTLTRDIDIAVMSVCPSVRPSVCLSVCLSVYL